MISNCIGFTTILELLIQNHANINIGTQDKQTPLLLAVKNGLNQASNLHDVLSVLHCFHVNFLYHAQTTKKTLDYYGKMVQTLILET